MKFMKIGNRLPRNFYKGKELFFNFHRDPPPLWKLNNLLHKQDFYKLYNIKLVSFNLLSQVFVDVFFRTLLFGYVDWPKNVEEHTSISEITENGVKFSDGKENDYDVIIKV